jgi:HPt (histidine-containing phosphotransfer) domain-containing protein
MRRVGPVAALVLCEIHDQLERLKDAASARDGETFRQLCHAVRGACLAIGATRMSRAAGDLETMCEGGQVAIAMKQLSRLAQISHDTLAAIETRLRPAS